MLLLLQEALSVALVILTRALPQEILCSSCLNCTVPSKLANSGGSASNFNHRCFPVGKEIGVSEDGDDNHVKQNSH